MKKIIRYIVIIFIISFNSNILADSIYIDSKNAICIDKNTYRVLYEKNAHEITPMASTTKIMTALVAIETNDLDRIITVSKKAASVRGNTVHLREGETLTLKELVVCLMAKSGNDAAIAIAEGISGTIEEFCKKMSFRATQMGLLNTNFINPHGLDADGHYTTCYDLAIIAAKAMENETFREIVGSKNYIQKGFRTSYQNINKILWKIPEATGIKTGYTGKAGKCLVTSALIGDDEVIIVTINSPDRWNSTSKIFNYVKENYNFQDIDYENNNIIALINEKNIKLKPIEKIRIPIKNSESLSTEIIIPEEISNNKLKEIENVGRVRVKVDEETVLEVPLKIIE